MWNLWYKAVPAVFTIAFLAIFAGFVWIVFWVAGVEPHPLHRVRPWIAIAFLWVVFGFGVRVFLAFLSSGMIDTEGAALVLAIVGWPLFLFNVLRVI